MSIPDLLAYASNKKSQALNSKMVTYSGIDCSVTDVMTSGFSILYTDALIQNSAGTRSVLLPKYNDDSVMVTLTNGQFMTFMRDAYSAAQQMQDVYATIITDILNSTITTEGQIDSEWTSRMAAYSTNRAIQSSIENLTSVTATNSSSISTLSSTVSTNTTNIATNTSNISTNTSNISTNTSAINSLTTLVNSLNPGGTVHVNSPSREIITNANAANGFQVSSSTVSNCKYDITLSCTATIGGSATATVIAEVAPTNSSNPADYVEYSRVSNSQTITLAIALQAAQIITVPLIVNDIPTGYWLRLRGVYSGTASATVQSSREKY